MSLTEKPEPEPFDDIDYDAPDDPHHVRGEFDMTQPREDSEISSLVEEDLEPAASLEFTSSDSPHEVIEKMFSAGGVFDDRGEFVPQAGVLGSIEALAGGNREAIETLPEHNGLRQTVLHLLESPKQYDELLDLIESVGDGEFDTVEMEPAAAPVVKRQTKATSPHRAARRLSAILPGFGLNR